MAGPAPPAHLPAPPTHHEGQVVAVRLARCLRGVEVVGALQPIPAGILRGREVGGSQAAELLKCREGRQCKNGDNCKVSRIQLQQPLAGSWAASKPPPHPGAT